MNSYFLDGTEITPRVEFNKTTGIFLIEGKSLPEDVKAFYTPLIRWVENYALKPNPTTLLTIDFEYFNTSSSKMILILLSKFRDIFKNGFDIRIVWRYPQLDAELEDAGEEFAELLNIPFEIVPK